MRTQTDQSYSNQLHDSRAVTPDQHSDGAFRDPHPVLRRALEAHQDDLRVSSRLPRSGTVEAPSKRLRFSDGFLGDARRAGLTAQEVSEAVTSGMRRRCWDGCLAIRDWYQGVELTLDPSGRYGLSIRRMNDHQ